MSRRQMVVVAVLCIVAVACEGGADGRADPDGGSIGPAATTPSPVGMAPTTAPARPVPATAPGPTGPSASSMPTGRVSSTIEAYDETSRTPIAELPARLDEVLRRQGADADAAQCLVDRILSSRRAGEIGASDLDGYVRLGTVTPPMTALLQRLQADGACAP